MCYESAEHCQNFSETGLDVKLLLIHFFMIRQFISLEETTLERADHTLQLLIFVTAKKEELMIIFFILSVFVS